MGDRKLSDTLELFRAAVSVPEPQVNLVEGALLLAQAEYPALDRAAYRGRLDEMGRQAGEACAGATLDRIAQLNRLMFDRWGFHGNRDDYYDPRNSFLNDVLDRRTGIPITLSLIYMEVGRRAGLRLVGIGMPGHFLVGCADRAGLYVDVFSEGTLMTPEDCAARLRELQPDLPFRPEFLAAVSPRQFLTRMLHNLLEIYLRTTRYPKAFAALEMIFCLEPLDAEWLRRRALVHYHLKNYSRAIADLTRYLELVAEAPDRDQVEQELAALHQLRSTVN